MKTRAPGLLAVIACLFALAIPAAPATSSSPCSPQQMGLLGYAPSISGNALALDVEGDYAYVGDWSGWLQVFRISDPCQPVRLPGAVQNPGNEIGDLEVHGAFAYVAADANGFAQYNIQVPSAPTLVSGRGDGSYALSVFYDGTRYAYVGHTYSGELAIYDMAVFPGTAPTHYAPVFAGHRDVYDTYVVGNRAYVYAGDGGENLHLQVVDVSQPGAPALSGDLALPLNMYGGAAELRVSGRYAYVATTSHPHHSGGLLIIDLADDAHPRVVGTYFTPTAGHTTWGKGAGLAIAGSRAYLVSQQGLNILDISNPTDPRLLTTFPFPESFGAARNGQVTVRDNLAYVTADSEGRGGLAIYNISESGAAQNSAFQRVWNRQDLAVSAEVSNRSWTWGPAPISGLLREAYAEGVDGQRLVQYFDKSRMEINDPMADQNQLWYVTNGLLPIELITGRMQIGNSQFELRGPAPIAAIGDPNQFPTYADLLPFYQSPGAVNQSDLGRPATGLLNSNGAISAFTDFIGDPATMLVRGDNNHGVARAFMDFMNQRGLVYENRRYVRAQVYDPLFVFGLPVSGAYWVKVKVAGKEMPVLFQIFERRVLTYNPANQPAFRVEMGNVGQHYYLWRYGK